MLKTKIFGKTSIAVKEQRIYFANLLLEDEQTLAYYGIRDQSRLFMNVIEEEFQIKIDIPKEMNIKLFVKPSTTVGRAK